ncbi:hypothetical protein PTKIN_Ptkin19aG0069500 [Pterospermum kingtungense]
MKRDHQEIYAGIDYGNGGGSGSKAETSSVGNPYKAKLWEEEQDAGGIESFCPFWVAKFGLYYNKYMTPSATKAQKLCALKSQVAGGGGYENGYFAPASK